MLRFDPNLRWMFTELPMLERYAAAARAGFKGVEVIVRPVAATSDRRSYVQRLGFVGLAVGVLAGLAAAVTREGRRPSGFVPG